ncbi:glycosyltransferase [Desulfocicer niacini]
MIKVAFLIDTISCETSGTEKQLLEILKRLDRCYISPELICLYESMWMKEHMLPCPVHILGYKGFLKFNFPCVVKKLARLFEARDYEIIHIFFEESIFVGYLGTFLSQNCPVLLSSRRDMGLGRDNKPWYHRYFPLILPHVNRKFDGIVANCRAVRRFVSQREKTPAEKIQVIFNGISIPPLKKTMPAVIQTMAQNVVRIGMVASLTPVKRHDLLFDALAQLMENEHVRPFKVFCLGEGWKSEVLKQQINKLGLTEIVYFTGAVNNVSDWLYCLDIGVLCSDREGLSNAVMEYMACGLPVVATSVGGIPELVDNKNGVCVPSGNVTALANALRLLINDETLRKKMGKESFLKLKRTFSWTRSLADLEAYYNKMLAKKY